MATANWYGRALEGQYGSTAARRVDWVGDTIKVALFTSAFTPNQDTQDFYDDLSSEVTGTGYTAGGAALSGKSVDYNATGNTTSLRASQTSWSTATFTARYAVIYKDTGSAATSPVLGWVDFGGDESVSSGTFTVIWDPTDGVLKITAA